MTFTQFAVALLGLLLSFGAGYQFRNRAIRDYYEPLLDAKGRLNDAQGKKIEAMETDLRAYENVMQTQEQVMRDYRHRGTVLEEKIKTLEKERDALSTELGGLKVKLLEQCAECEALRTKCDTLEAELAKVNDPEVQRVVAMRKQLKQDNDAANLLYNYNQEIAYGMVSATDLTRMEGDDR